MEKEKIIKALEWCVNKKGCKGCPYLELDEDSCADMLMANALDLIKELEQRIPQAIGNDDITFLVVQSGAGGAVLVHRETKVMYIRINGGISVMLDEEGKPLLWEGAL